MLESEYKKVRVDPDGVEHFLEGKKEEEVAILRMILEQRAGTA